MFVVSVDFQDVSFGLVPQSARVWLPDPEEVWRSAELTRAFTPGDQVLSLRLEDGSVRDRQCIGNVMQNRPSCRIKLLLEYFTGLC